jgi:hypothetical protein
MMKKLLQAKMKDVPQEQQDKIFALLEKNPQLFQTIAEKSQQKMKQGMSQMDAVKAVIAEHESELKDALE